MFTNMHSITAILAAATLAHGHMIMQSPKPFGGPDLDNSPLTSSNYPCKLKGDPATFYKGDLGNTMAVGETQTLSFKGSAVHGGGSCQLAVTDDLQPSATTSWKVIQSIEGGCPSKSGSGPDTYDFQIPDGFAPGKYVFAWTWVSKLAGQGEFYMNCAPITVTAGKKRAADNATAAAPGGSFPELFVANLAEINECKTQPSTDVEYPVPGSDVKNYGTPKLAPPTGQNCFPKGITSSSGGSGKSGPAAGNQSSSSAAPPSSSTAAPGNSKPAVFITVVSGASGSAGASATATSPTASPSSTIDVDPISTPSDTGASSSAAQSPATQSSAAVVSSPTSSAAPATSSGPAGGNGSPGALTGKCSEEGVFNCIGGTSYQQCASGSWSTVMQLAPTVKCKEGLTMNLWGRDESPLRRLRRRAR
ncbi:hypothetical protein Hte_010984 [Hypoxylon texense]